MKSKDRMKRCFITIFLIIAFLCGIGQTVPSSCIASDSIYKKYRKSADKLTVVRCEKIGDTYKDSVSINKAISNQYLKALVAVYNATSLAGRDTVIRIINIVKDYVCPPDLNSIAIKVDSNQLWMKNLRNNVVPCGNTSIDSLITKYHLVKTGYSHTFNTSLHHIVSFKTDSNCYINRLCDRFNTFYLQGINYSQPNNANKARGFDITDSVNVNFIELTYTYSWGDCTSGCLYNRHWKFRVYNDCSVEYLGSYGNSIQGFFTGITKENTSAEIRVFPNPVKNILSVVFSAPLKKNTRLTLYNFIGQSIYQLNDPGTDNKVDLSFLARGVYNLKIEDDEGQRSFKVVKE